MDATLVLEEHCSDLLAPENYLLLLEIAAILLIYQHKVERVATAEAIIYVFICRCEIGCSEVEANRNEFTLDWCPIHDLKLAECLLLCDGIRVRSDRLLPNDRQLHHFDLYTNEVEADLA